MSHTNPPPSPSTSPLARPRLSVRRAHHLECIHIERCIPMVPPGTPSTQYPVPLWLSPVRHSAPQTHPQKARTARGPKSRRPGFLRKIFCAGLREKNRAEIAQEPRSDCVLRKPKSRRPAQKKLRRKRACAIFQHRDGDAFRTVSHKPHDKPSGAGNAWPMRNRGASYMAHFTMTKTGTNTVKTNIRATCRCTGWARHCGTAT